MMILHSHVWLSSPPRTNDLKITAEELYSTARPVLDAGRAVSFRAAGNSMCPFIRDGEQVQLRASSAYRKGDVVLCMTDERKVVLHYIVSVGSDVCVLMGASNLKKMERCRYDAIIGRVESPAIGRMQGRIWHSIRLLRRYLLWIYRKYYDSKTA